MSGQCLVSPSLNCPQGHCPCPSHCIRHPAVPPGPSAPRGWVSVLLIPPTLCPQGCPARGGGARTPPRGLTILVGVGQLATLPGPGPSWAVAVESSEPGLEQSLQRHSRGDPPSPDPAPWRRISWSLPDPQPPSVPFARPSFEKHPHPRDPGQTLHDSLGPRGARFQAASAWTSTFLAFGVPRSLPQPADCPPPPGCAPSVPATPAESSGPGCWGPCPGALPAGTLSPRPSAALLLPWRPRSSRPGPTPSAVLPSARGQQGPRPRLSAVAVAGGDREGLRCQHRLPHPALCSVPAGETTAL